MPPERRDVDRVARFQLGRYRCTECIGESREAFEIGGVQLDEAHRRAGRREIERTDVEVCDLLWREERESATAGDYAADVVPLVEMRWSGDGVAEPDAREHGAVEDSEAVFG